jgi:hypothetical protein
MFLFYNFVDKEFTIFPSEHFNQEIELGNFNFNIYVTDTELIRIHDMNEFYEMVKEYKEIIMKPLQFTDMCKKKYRILRSVFGPYTLYQIICV